MLKALNIYKDSKKEGGEFIMRKTILLLVLSLFTVALVYSTASAQTMALYMLTNIAKVTANNIAPNTTITDSANQTVATMFGGKFTAVAIRTQSALGGGGVIWNIQLTNKGNATSPFTIKFSTVQSNPAGSTWDAAFQNGTRSFNVTPAAGGVISFSVCLTDSVPAQANGAYIRVRVIASNTAGNITTANGATNYLGDNGIAYGGTMGENWTGVTTPATWRCVTVQQGVGYDGFLTLIIQAPVLNITKTIQRITKGGIASGAIPGATIQYRIFITNSGTAAAVSTKIVDTTAAAAMVTYGAQISITNLTAYDTTTPNLAWSNASGSLAVGGRGVVIYTVRIN
jgi:hypothetical protein